MPPLESCEAAGALAWVSGVDSMVFDAVFDAVCCCDSLLVVTTFFQKPLFDPEYQKVRLLYSLLLWIHFQVEQLLHLLC